MEAVSQRKANKEQKLRAKESRANKLAEKSKRKRDHFNAVEDWKSARGSEDALMESLDGKKRNRKRAIADKKYGFGGKRGRFKQSDPKSKNDISAYNPRGNFEGGMKKSHKSYGGSGANRRGKRARDASKSRRSS